MPMDLRLGDVVEVKKNHPCGNNKFEILRTGMDFRIRCLGCDRQVWISRVDLEKRVKKIIERKEE
ncbi:hypothetical protein HNQ80_004715 [Anaerosolibacter carboniphilus]|uniref:DUF951 domain-containing protein n=1 Tax=Anaerosolibacter carboniphilus TaxID=1417629 RepID=A0A841KYI8_9FIRM|nr:DUF951 domain-containing protein [Anaerosolibacter carboniphilus]MBB6218541.1 hypothetical protein [Anaerosolibacter carboniphilus]